MPGSRAQHRFDPLFDASCHARKRVAHGLRTDLRTAGMSLSPYPDDVRGAEWYQVALSEAVSTSIGIAGTPVPDYACSIFSDALSLKVVLQAVYSLARYEAATYLRNTLPTSLLVVKL